MFDWNKTIDILHTWWRKDPEHRSVHITIAKTPYAFLVIPIDEDSWATIWIYDRKIQLGKFLNLSEAIGEVPLENSLLDKIRELCEILREYHIVEVISKIPQADALLDKVSEFRETLRKHYRERE